MTRPRSGFVKRQKEMARFEKRQQKLARRQKGRLAEGADLVDGDVASQEEVDATLSEPNDPKEAD